MKPGLSPPIDLDQSAGWRGALVFFTDNREFCQMTYRSILALVAPSTEHNASIGPIALDLAARWKAHLTVFIPVPHLATPVYAGAPGGAVIVTEEDTVGLGHARQIAERIERAAKANGVTVQMMIESAEYGSILRSLSATARLVELAVMRRSGAMPQDSIESLLFAAGCPLLIVPEQTETPLKLAKVMIGWDGGLESARAIRAAIPILEKAKTVEIVTVTGEKELGKQAAGVEVARMLARHDIKVETTELPLADTAGKRLIDHGVLKHSDLIVAGAYGHSRLRQFFFGGVTTSLLAEAKMPILLAH
jgi:nucleotide-binding universal stress UspA family protein